MTHSESSIPAIVVGRPRTVSTKYGKRSVLDARTREGQDLTVWGSEADLEILNRRDGEKVAIAMANGKPKLVAHAGSGLAPAPDKKSMGFVQLPGEAERALQRQLQAAIPFSSGSAPELLATIDRIGEAFARCLAIAEGNHTTALALLDRVIGLGF